MVVRGSKWENDYKEILMKRGWIVPRSAGSMGLCDLTPVPPPKSLIDEVKPSKIVEVKSQSKYRNSWIFNCSRNNDIKQQYEMLKLLAEYGYDVEYAIRWKNYPKHHGKDKIDKFEIFKLGEVDKYITRSNQEYPSFKVGTGHKVQDVYEDYSSLINPHIIYGEYIEGK